MRQVAGDYEMYKKAIASHIGQMNACGMKIDANVLALVDMYKAEKWHSIIDKSGFVNESGVKIDDSWRLGRLIRDLALEMR